MSSVGVLEDKNSWSSELVTLINMEEPGARVTCFSQVDEAIRAVAIDRFAPDVWLVDLMMPTGTVFNDTETESGKATGERFILEFLELGKSVGPTVIVYSQRSSVSALPDTHPRLIYMPKAEFSSVEVATQVKNLLKSKG